jgi:hypothetical protein
VKNTSRIALGPDARVNLCEIPYSQINSLLELGAIVCEGLKNDGLEAFLSGGAVVSIYTNNKYESYDLDFVSMDDRTSIKRCMEKLGFRRHSSRYFVHPNNRYFVEFPGSAVAIGDELISEFFEIKVAQGTLKLLTPTDCVKDRLAAFYHWNDPQSLDQAIMVAKAHPIKIESVKKWSAKEGMSEKFKVFMDLLKDEGRKA